MKLYDITENLIALDALLQEQGGDVTEGTQGEALEKWITEYEWLERNKIDAYGSHIANINSDIDAINEEVERLRARASAYKNQIERMKWMVKTAMDMRGIKKLEGQKFTISIQKNGGAQPVEITAKSIEFIPDKFMKIERRPDLELIRKAIENNDPEVANVATLKERGESVRIR